MRVIAGALKGRKLIAPRGGATRPTADQVRIALLDTLGPWLIDSRVLDLFAGAGGVGLEALSRGAAQATFVERDPRALAALAANIAALSVAEQARVIRGDVVRTVSRLGADGARFDVIFLDPPYETRAAEETLVAIAGARLLADGGVVVAQHFTKRRLAATVGELRAFRARRFGETTLTFFRTGE
jgi:16S rRNA (guanine966-N2)-methyltransferase